VVCGHTLCRDGRNASPIALFTKEVISNGEEEGCQEEGHQEEGCEEEEVTRLDLARP
jgi:hypothetical protein